MFSTQHAKHAAPRQTDTRRLVQRATVVAAGTALLSATLGVGVSSAVTINPENVTIVLPDGTPSYLALKLDLDGDRIYETVHEHHIPGRKDQTLTLGISGKFTDAPSVSIVGSCRTVSARFEDNAFAYVADHAYQPTKQDPATGQTVDDGVRKTDTYGRGAVADTANPGFEYVLCR